MQLFPEPYSESLVESEKRWSKPFILSSPATLFLWNSGSSCPRPALFFLFSNMPTPWRIAIYFTVNDAALLVQGHEYRLRLSMLDSGQRNPFATHVW